MIPIRRALLSVSDKTGIVELARALHAHGCELVSTGGTRQALQAAGLPATEIGAVTGRPEAFGGRMKTLSFELESALLFDRERDRAEAERLGIRPIDMVVCNLYPFAKHRDAGADLPTLLENVDVGGPTMIRAAAKNSRWVAAVTRPAQYPAVEQALRAHGGALPRELLARLMREAFEATADYDAMIADALAERAGERSVRLHFRDARELRYGENPHQKAALLREAGAAGSLHDLVVHGGKELSFNNLTDLAAAAEAAGSLARQGCAIVKHANPCGLAESESQREAFERAWAGDPVSAFGSVVAFNRPLAREAVQGLALDHPDKGLRRFVEVIAAPGFEPGAVEYLKASKSLRIVQLDPAAARPAWDDRLLPGALLRQERDDRPLFARLEVATRRAPATLRRGLLEFGLIAVRQLKSNAIALVRETDGGGYQLLGMGAGQPNRVNATRLAVERARANLESEYDGPSGDRECVLRERMGQAMLVSDAFFPFPDSIEVCAAAGVREVYQPGGSLRDAEVVARCDALEVAMVFTGLRHFKH